LSAFALCVIIKSKAEISGIDMFDLIHRFGIDTSGFDRWALHFSGASSTAAWIAASVFAILFIILAWRSVRGAPKRIQALSLFTLRVLSAILILGCLFQPAIRLLKTTRVKTRLAILIDTSESMSVPVQEKGDTRIEQVDKFLKSHEDYFQGLAEKFSIDYFGFDQGIHALSGEIPPLKELALGKGTEILESLSELERFWRGGPLAGVVLFSDGQDTGRLKRLLKIEDKDQPEQGIQIKELLELGAPVNTITAGLEESLSDISVREVVHDEYAFVHNPFDVLVRIGVSGRITSMITVTLKSRDQVLSSKDIRLKPEDKEAEVKLEFIPRQVGEFFYTVEVPVYADEASARNNRKRFVLNVLRDKVRVLYIVGNPSWDERFLRRALKKNPSVDLVSFYILREYFDNPYAPERELALIPFPTHELFTNELDTFDLVIFQNFFGVEYMQHEYMKNLNRFVRERGGGLLVIGGIRSFLYHSFNLPLEDVLPVRFSQEIPNYRDGEFSMRLTPSGRRHPVTQLSPRPEENEQMWGALPELKGFNVTMGVHPEGVILGEHPFQRTADGKDNLPVIAVRDAGRGRTMIVATDATWQWNFLAVGQGRSGKPYQVFWDRALRWLLKDPQMKTVSLTKDKGRYELSEDVTLALEVLDKSYQPAEGAEVRLQPADQPEGSDLEIPQPQPAGRGKYIFHLKPKIQGGYRIRARAEMQGRLLGEDDAIFEVAEDNPEFEDLSARPDLMTLLAERTGGASININDSPESLTFQNPEVEKIIGTREFPLWDNALALALIAALLILEWFLRRRWGLS
jgi:uncharacterized membrane protein